MLAKVSAPHTFNDTVALAPYRAPLVRACIHEAKFARNERAIALLGQLLGEYLNATFPHETKSDIHLVPIPLSEQRLRERGYNQVLEITYSARPRARHIHIHETLLQKIRHTPSQTSLTRSERLQNLNGVFAVGEHAVPLTAHLILFDDVVTTGTTLAEAARALTRAGFTHIDQLALAH